MGLRAVVVGDDYDVGPVNNRSPSSIATGVPVSTNTSTQNSSFGSVTEQSSGVDDISGNITTSPCSRRSTKPKSAPEVFQPPHNPHFASVELKIGGDVRVDNITKDLVYIDNAGISFPPIRAEHVVSFQMRVDFGPIGEFTLRLFDPDYIALTEKISKAIETSKKAVVNRNNDGSVVGVNVLSEDAISSDGNNNDVDFYKIASQSSVFQQVGIPVLVRWGYFSYPQSGIKQYEGLDVSRKYLSDNHLMYLESFDVEYIGWGANLTLRGHSYGTARTMLTSKNSVVWGDSENILGNPGRVVEEIAKGNNWKLCPPNLSEYTQTIYEYNTGNTTPLSLNINSEGTRREIIRSNQPSIPSQEGTYQISEEEKIFLGAVLDDMIKTDPAFAADYGNILTAAYDRAPKGYAPVARAGVNPNSIVIEEYIISSDGKVMTSYPPENIIATSQSADFTFPGTALNVRSIFIADSHVIGSSVANGEDITVIRGGNTVSPDNIPSRGVATGNSPKYKTWTQPGDLPDVIFLTEVIQRELKYVEEYASPNGEAKNVVYPVYLWYDDSTNTLHAHPIFEEKGFPIKKRYVYSRDRSNTVISFTPSVNKNALAYIGLAGTIVRGTNLANQDAIEALSFYDTSGIANAEVIRGTTKVLSTDTTQEKLGQDAQQIYREKEIFSHTATLVVIGDPNIHPYDDIEIIVHGKRDPGREQLSSIDDFFSGRWMSTRITHSIQQGKYETIISLVNVPDKKRLPKEDPPGTFVIATGPTIGSNVNVLENASEIPPVGLTIGSNVNVLENGRQPTSGK